MLFLVETAGRQMMEQKQYRTARTRTTATSTQRKAADVGKCSIEAEIKFIQMY